MVFYGDKEYWNKRYSYETKPYEWYQSFQSFRHLLNPTILSASLGLDPAQPPHVLDTSTLYHQQNSTRPTQSFKADSKVLILGCGNSRLSEDMLRDGWTGGITNVDFSDVVIEQMKRKYTDGYHKRFNIAIPHYIKKSEVNKFICADVTQGLPFQDKSFDIIICKGCMDAILQNPGGNVRRMMEECHRVLRDGTLIVISHGNPESRMVHFENEHDEWWENVEIHTIHKRRTNHEEHDIGPSYHYAYICKKLPSVSSS